MFYGPIHYFLSVNYFVFEIVMSVLVRCPADALLCDDLLLVSKTEGDLSWSCVG